MVETWEIEWNSSMIEHGVDVGTMEFIFAKGGNLTDVNYVMLNQHDDTWEPLIKAVAERDNSHPDIIRKNVPQQPQQPFGVAQGFTPAIEGTVGNTNTAFRNARDARRLLGAQRALDSQEALNQGQRTVGNLARTGQYGQAAGRAVGQGVKGIGRGIAGAGRFMGDKAGQAGRFLADKFPGAKQRMTNFMQGVGDVARHGREGLRDYRAKTQSDKKDRMRRNVIEGDNARLEDQRQRAYRETGGKGSEYDRQMEMIAQTPLAQRQAGRDEDMRAISGGKDPETGKQVAGRLNEPQTGLFRRIRDLGAKRRGEQMTDEQMQEAQRAAQTGNQEAVEAINQQIDSAPERLQESVNTDTPPPPAVTPQPVEPEQPQEETFQINNEPTEQPQEETFQINNAPEVDDEREKFAQQMLNEAGYSGGRSTAKAREVALGLFDKPESYEAITSATGNRGYRGKLAQAVAAYHGMTPAQADATVQSAEQGNPDAKQKVEEATGGEDMKTLVTFSSDKHTASWDALLKGLNIR